MVLSPGATLGPYHLLARLGQGAMGTVFRARDASGAEVALKVIASEDARNQTFVERFRREATAAAAVVHPHVARCLGSGEAAGRLYLALELVPGGTLAERLHRTGRLGWREAVQRGVEIAGALEAVHAVGLVHRDLKPQNVLLDAQGRSKLADFGIARGVAEANKLTRTGEVLGSAEYMAPEQAGASSNVDARADLYALGATLYMLIVGQAPFSGSLIAILKHKLTEAPPRLRSREPSVPPALDALVASLLAVSPGGRPPSARAVREALQALGGQKDHAAGSSRRLALAGLTFTLALAGGAAALGLWPGPPSPPVARATSEPSPKGSAAGASSSPVASSAPVPLPAWFVALEPRPALPDGVKPTAVPGEYRNERDHSLLLYVPAGTFAMGRDGPVEGSSRPNAWPEEHPAHDVALSAYFLGKLEVSNDQFGAFCRAAPYATEVETGAVPGSVASVNIGEDAGVGFGPVKKASWKRPHGTDEQIGDRPVCQVTWNDACAYARWAGLRLATEAEWERAASWDGTKASRYPWGDEYDGTGPLKANVFAVGKAVDGEPLLPVTRAGEDRSPIGALHMCGNVSEWVLDWATHRYPTELQDPCFLEPPPGESPRSRACKGGSFLTEWDRSRCQFRGQPLAAPNDMLGFRVALSAGVPRSWEARLPKATPPPR